MGVENSAIRMTLKDEVSRAAKKINKNLNMTGVLRGNVVSFNAALDVAGKFFRVLKAGVGVVAEFIKLANEQERVEAQLAQTLKSTGSAAGFTATEIIKQAAALQKLTTFGDEAIIGAQNLLLTFTQIKDDVFPKATEIVLDMSQAMGQDLKSSAILVGKALNDPILGVSALSRVGITFTKQQKEQIKVLVKTGKVMEAQKLILKELNTQFGGSAAAAAKTFGGQMKQLGNEIGDAKEKMGKMITESADLQAVIKTLADIARDLGKTFFDNMGDLDDLGNTGKNTFQFIFDGIKFVRRSMVGLNTVLKTAKNTLSLLQEVGTNAWTAIKVSISTVVLETRKALKITLEVAAALADKFGADQKAIGLRNLARVQGRAIAAEQKKNIELNKDLKTSQDRVNFAIEQYKTILDEGREALIKIDLDSIKWTETLNKNTRAARSAKEEVRKLKEAEKELSDQRAFEKEAASFGVGFGPEPVNGAGVGVEGALGGQSPAVLSKQQEIEELRRLGFEVVDFEKGNLEAMRADREKANANRITAAKSVIDSILSIQGTGSKKMFKVQKAANIAQAIMATWTAAAEALKLGPIAGPIAAGAIIASGLARVKQIASTKFGGSAAGGGGGAGGRIKGGFAPARPQNDLFQRGAGFQAAPIRGRQEGIVVNINTGGAPIVRENQLTDFIIEGLKNRLGRDGNSFETIIGAA